MTAQVRRRGFLFDLDGTLVDCERETGEALARALHAHDIAIDRFDRELVIGRSWVEIYDVLKQRYSQLEWTRDELIARTALARADVLTELGVTVLPGARRALAWTRGAPRALVTGSARVETTQVLPLIGPEATFDAIIAAEDVPRSKPAPDGYLAAIAALGLAAADCIVIEDSVTGIAAGRAAGCVVVAVRAGNFGGWDQSAAHRVIDSLEEFTPSLVDELASIDPSDYGSKVKMVPVP